MCVCVESLPFYRKLGPFLSSLGLVSYTVQFFLPSYVCRVPLSLLHLWAFSLPPPSIQCNINIITYHSYRNTVCVSGMGTNLGPTVVLTSTQLSSSSFFLYGGRLVVRFFIALSTGRWWCYPTVGSHTLCGGHAV